MIVNNPLYHGIPVYEDATMPHWNSEEQRDVHVRVLNLPGKGEMVLCSSQFLLELKERYGGEKE